MRNLRYILPVLTAVLVLVFPGPARAFEFRSGNAVTVAGAPLPKGTLVVSGKTIEVDTPVDGDLICAGQEVTVKSNVSGDVLCAAQHLMIEGAVAGSIRTVSQSLTVNGDVARSITSVGQTMAVSPSSHVGRDAFFAGQTVTQSGSVSGDLAVAADDLAIAGAVGGSVNADVSLLSVDRGASIGGNLTYTGKRTATIDPGATVSGQVRYTPQQEKASTAVKQQPQAADPAAAVRGFVIRLLINLAVALIVFGLFPKLFSRLTDLVLASPLPSMGIGFLAIAVLPIAFVMLLVTVIGIPVAILLIPVAIALGYFGRIVVGSAIGKRLLARTGRPETDTAASVTVGIILVFLASRLPILGGLVTLVVVLTGFGAVVRGLFVRSR